MAVIAVALPLSAALDIPFQGHPFMLGMEATLLPLASAIVVRRLHDTDRGGWLLLPLMAALAAIVAVEAGIPDRLPVAEAAAIGLDVTLFLVGALALTVIAAILCMPGTPGANRFGPRPGTPAG